MFKMSVKYRISLENDRNYQVSFGEYLNEIREKVENNRGEVTTTHYFVPCEVDGFTF